MFGAKTKKKEEQAAGLMQKSARGNMDEYEALRTIVAENSALLSRILDKIRVHRTLSGKTSSSKVEEKKQGSNEGKGDKTK
ncbi:MAG: hypothetical protein NT027_03350 [Proteobacteria bacterium]|nr:hypothetical protein [Pseudomonadota bacterium]